MKAGFLAGKLRKASTAASGSSPASVTASAQQPRQPATEGRKTQDAPRINVQDSMLQCMQLLRSDSDEQR